MNRKLAFLSILAAIAIPVAAQAHFLWAVADPATKTFSVVFAESPGDSVVPKVAGKADLVKGWIGEGKSVPLAVDADGLKGALGKGAAGVTLDYGVLDKTAEGRGKFLLRYYAKAASDVKASQVRVGLPIELSLKKSGEALILTVLKEKQPVANAEVTITFKGVEKPLLGKTDDKGKFALPPAPEGPIAVRVMVATNTPGKVGDAAYDLTRDYSSLTVASH